ncbi:MAG: MtnX-like HAD-IB family phosphatase [Bacillota bacterium]|nr:MtnX-like HAD-IB family phosphatase [Bacillota bacterium]
MKNFAFVSDFDGTLTDRDFYHIVIDKYLKDWGRNFYIEWKKTNKINVDFLNRIFGSLKLTENELHDEILQLPFDRTAVSFMDKVNNAGGRFYILSAGTSYYIEILLKHLNISNVSIISMKGIYKDGGISIIPDEKSPYYSDIFGLDKKKVIEELKEKHGFVFFAGDSEPDLTAAKTADTAFAKAELAELLQKENGNFIPFKKYKEIEKYLTDKGWFE